MSEHEAAHMHSAARARVVQLMRQALADPAPAPDLTRALSEARFLLLQIDAVAHGIGLVLDGMPPCEATHAATIERAGALAHAAARLAALGREQIDRLERAAPRG